MQFRQKIDKRYEYLAEEDAKKAAIIAEQTNQIELLSNTLEGLENIIKGKDAEIQQLRLRSENDSAAFVAYRKGLEHIAQSVANLRTI